MLQILYEHGFLDPSKSIHSYTMTGRNNEYGHIIPGTTLKKMISLCLDYQSKETILNHHERFLNVVVDRTPKYHPEIAGEGVDYS